MTDERVFRFPNGVPRNRLGLDDHDALNQIERDISTARLQEIQMGQSPPATRQGYDLEHLKAIHAHLFSDLYEWAGHTKSEPMTIGGQVFQAAPQYFKDDGRSSRPFLHSHLVNPYLTQVLGDLQQRDHLRGLSREDFAEQSGTLFARLNYAHPFMEGNGRTQREFLRQVAEQAGHPLQFRGISQERMTQVSLAARHGDDRAFPRLMLEVTDPHRMALLQRAVGFLEREGRPWQDYYLSTATPGRQYDGQVAIYSSQLVILRAEDQVLVAQARDIPQPHGQVQFTASPYDGHPGRQHGLDWD